MTSPTSSPASVPRRRLHPLSLVLGLVIGAGVAAAVLKPCNDVDPKPSPSQP